MINFLNKTQVIAEGLDHPECIAYHPDGTLWAGGEAGQIYKITSDNQIEVVASTGGFILGIAFNPDRSWLLICDSGKKCLWRMDTSNYSLTKFADGVAGHTFNIPNYACFDSKGNVYVSESGAFRKTTGKILKFDSDGTGVVWCNGPFNFANGMAIDAAENYIYVVCSFMPGVERVRINPDGTAGTREVFVTLPESVPDGLAFDANGNLYVSCYAPNKIYKVDQNRTVSVLIDDWEAHTLSNPTNIAFGGDAFDQLFVANIGRWHITKIDLGIKGLKLVCHS
ncbi:MAG: SMP-30/gluconolactonase/LRE family protein [Bacteroidetes bacterium CHB5]|nr:SMP-30/gluconolactonase/LRE family protein [Bacteroidetes bacterium CHB5]